MTKAKCPVCNANSPVKTYQPFCSRRCADVDLSRWLKGGYAIPGRPADQAEEAPSLSEREDG